MSIFVSIATPFGNPHGVAPSKSAVVGDWEEEPGTCEGDNGISYDANGRFFGYDYEGRWKLNGETLTTIITKRMGPDEKWRRLTTPERGVSTIVALTRERMVERETNGSLRHLHRCR
ncbi:MAG: hypothetical protein ABIQ32_00010 [Sphingomicrobium sp.]